VHGFLFLYALMGEPEKTSHWVRQVATRLYTPDSLPGDEDNGEMSAWYIWATLGMFPQCPGKPDLVRFEPLAKLQSTLELNAQR
jgi:putative alpha-1,2-mannosidase